MDKPLKNYLKKTKYFACLAIMVFSALAPLKVFAYDEGFFAANDILFYNPDDCTGGGSTTPSTGASNGSIVVIGDSLMDNDKSVGGLADKLKAKGYSDVTIDSAASRSLTSPGVGQTSGIDSIEANKAKITSAGTIVIELGTNDDSSEINKIPTLMKKVHKINADIRAFWVNTANYGDPSRANGVNDGIDKYASAQKYTIIDWHKAVYPNGSADTSLLSLGDGGYHQSNPKGINKHVSVIVDAVGESSSGDGSGGGGAGGGAPMTGSQQDKDAATVWNILTGKGLSAEQAAGILGNLQAESGIEPAREQNSPSGSITKHMKLDGVTGYGIAQWTSSGRQDGLHAAMVAAGKSDDTDITVQANYLWHELSTSYKSTVLDPLKKTTTVRAAAVIILLKFEAPANQDSGVQDDRTGFAEKWFKKFNGLTGTGSTNCTCTTNSSGNVSGTKPKILIGPGHTGTSDSQYSGPAPGIKDTIYGNTPELQDAWDVAQKVKTALTAKGYEVLMTKNSADGGTFQWNRAKQANDNNVDLAFEIHTDSTHAGKFGDWGYVWSQFKGAYATDKNNHKVNLSASDSVIEKSKEYAKKFATARTAAGEKGMVTETEAGFYSKPDPQRNTTLVQLWSKVPWIYLEAGADSSKDGQSSGGITDAQKTIYAKGIVDGVVASIPPGSGGSEPDCGGASSGDASAIVDWALKLAWDDSKHNHGPFDPTDLYKKWQDKIYGTSHPGFVGYAACNAFVAVTMRASGADPEYSLGGVSAGGSGTQLDHIEKHPELYQRVDNPSTTKNLQPGDILILRDKHTGIFVGDQTGGNTRESSLNSTAPGASEVSWYPSYGEFMVYRLK